MNVCLVPATIMCERPLPAEERVYLPAGAIHVAQSPALVTTIVGSSVAVCLWSPAAAGISHFVLPRGGDAKSPRFANHALPMLAGELLRLGAERTEIFAAMFGGAGELGKRNVSEALEFLARHDIPLMRRDAGGNAGRKLTFRTFDGSTIVRKL